MDDQTVVAAGQPAAQLVVRQGVRMGKAFPLGRRPVVLGRDEKADISLPDPEVSRLHARISWFEAQYVIEDLRSTNGTYLNGVLLRAPRPLSHGDKIAMGQTVLEFEWLAGEPSHPAGAQTPVLPLDQPHPAITPEPRSAIQPPTSTSPAAPSPHMATPAAPQEQKGTSSGINRCLLVGCGCLVLLAVLVVGAFVLVWFASPEWMRELQNILDRYQIPLQLVLDVPERWLS
ncbi:MAG: FHA domain-containing protein [Anaerolineae bacterium]|nr:FHA domain-containing protein [Anaerolineae bacterium]MDW8071412.1 FHA domain-containing protein [Anaerolineae bacterium]